MAQIAWTEPALQDLDRIADYIALDHPDAARAWVNHVFERVERLAAHPHMGKKVAELPGSRYRELHIPPARIFYKRDVNWVYIVYVMRSERDFDAGVLESRG